MLKRHFQLICNYTYTFTFKHTPEKSHDASMNGVRAPIPSGAFEAVLPR